MINCPTCEFADFDKDKCKRLLIRLPHICPYAVERKPRNNFERIKAMSMEELAAFINGAESEGRAYGPKGKNAWLNWLKQEDV
jgi:hypothetical protein